MNEVLLHVAPVLNSDGIRRFSQNGIAGRTGAVRLEKTELSEAGQITNMRFRFTG
ncbi:hypothetical protein [Mesorhizobium sp.]|uniref:hypothetical protein n=1 Tax=Mesorhizobium sp. TaxID=1871066 RepID=UPI00257E67B0|nr:hypothetical protein [Mesorhizobium sp.]